MHFLVTGHTGFKGAWLCLLLKERGHQVSGFSDIAEQESLFSVGHLVDILNFDLRGDIREIDSIEAAYAEVKPDFVIHFAAQSLVRKSYLDPVSTIDTNVSGTLNVLRASQNFKKLKGQLIVTTDKVYRNVGKSRGYTEEDALGGQDPYSASKAMADIATQSWLKSFENPATAIARAGNVIGGGDICSDRLIPDLVHSFKENSHPMLRAPKSIRPWQHVLDCLNGYLILVDAIIQKNECGEWNFGPNENQAKTVADVANLSQSIWGSSKNWLQNSETHPHEATTLILNSDKAREKLGWQDKLNFEESIGWTINWYKNVHNGSDPLHETMLNIRAFESK
jgi:CDP-glucose 4,6-dehydratase